MFGVTRFDETWHRLREWTAGQTPSERLAAQVLDAVGYEEIDPAHPLGGKDGGADALVMKDGRRWVMAVYFPRGQQTIGDITRKFTSDLAAAKKKAPDLVGFVFVTNQELLLAQREEFCALGDGVDVDLLHLERVAMILDTPRMSQVREQFLDISAGPRPMLVSVEIDGAVRSFAGAEEVREKVVEIYEDELRRGSERAKARGPVSPLNAISIIGVPEMERRVLSDREIEEDVHRFDEELTGRWDSCQEYLAAVAWPAVHFRITNEEESFLTNVQVILTFHGARGLEFADIDSFEWERLKDPAWEPPLGPYGLAIPRMPNLVPSGYPVSWQHNDDGDLEIIIDLPELRPYPPLRFSEDDVVLILDNPTREVVTVTYTVTAHGYGTFFEGDPIEVPVEHVAMAESVIAAIRAAEDED